jgi:isoleucyl-tRNA synthetase
VPYEEMLEIDRWALAQKELLIKKCLKSYEDYQFHQAYSALYHFCVVDMSAFYLDILKDRLYTHATHSLTRRSAQTALWEILDAFTRLIAPILSFTSEEVYDAMFEGFPAEARAESVHVLLFPKYAARPDEEQLIAEWDKIKKVRESVQKSLEEDRQSGTIGNPLDAKAVIRAAGQTYELLRRHEEDLRYIFIVSQVVLEEDPGTEDGLQIEIVRADGQKCERCWNYSVQVGVDEGFPTLCERCIPAVNEIANYE